MAKENYERVRNVKPIPVPEGPTPTGPPVQPTGSPVQGVTTPPGPPSTQEEPGVVASMLDDLYENYPQLVGGTIGGLYGAARGAKGGPTGALLGGAVGAFSGGAGGKGWDITIDALKGRGTPLTASEALKEMGIAGLTEGATELAGGVVAKPLGKLIDPILTRLTPFRNALTEEGLRAFKTLEKYMPKTRTPYTPAELTESRALDLVQNVCDKALLSGPLFGKFTERIRKQAFEELVDDTAKLYGSVATPQELGELVINAIGADKAAITKSLFDPLYNRVTALTKDSNIPTTLWKYHASQMLKDVQHLGGIEAQASGDEIVRLVSELPDSVPFSAAKELRSRLISINKKIAPKAHKVGAEFVQLIDNSMEETIKALPDKAISKEALETWRYANQMYGEYSDVYLNRFIKKLVATADPKKGGNPDALVNMIFKKRGRAGIENVKTILGKDKFTQLQSWHIQQLLEPSKDMSIPLGANLEKTMYSKTGMGRSTMEAVYSKEQLRGIDDVANALKVAQKRQASGTGGMLIQLAQGSAAYALLQGDYEKASGLVLFGPAILARMMVSPRLAKTLVQGLKMPRMTPQVFMRLTSVAEIIQKQIRSEMKKEGEVEASGYVPTYPTTIMQGPTGDYVLGEPGGEIELKPNMPPGPPVE